MGVAATMVEVEGMTEDTVRTGVRAGIKGVHKTLTIPKTVIGTSAVIRPTVTEVCRDDHNRSGSK